MSYQTSSPTAQPSFGQMTEPPQTLKILVIGAYDFVRASCGREKRRVHRGSASRSKGSLGWAVKSAVLVARLAGMLDGCTHAAIRWLDAACSPSTPLLSAIFPLTSLFPSFFFPALRACGDNIRRCIKRRQVVPPAAIHGRDVPLARRDFWYVGCLVRFNPSRVYEACD